MTKRNRKTYTASSSQRMSYLSDDYVTSDSECSDDSAYPYVYTKFAIKNNICSFPFNTANGAGLYAGQTFGRGFASEKKVFDSIIGD